MAAAEETEIILDGKLLALGVTDLTEFGLYLKVEKAKIKGQTKVKIIKVIRTELEKIINTFDSDKQTNEYLKGLIDFLDENAQPKPSDEEGNTLKPSSELEKLEIELKAIESQQKAIQEKLLQVKQSENIPKSSGSSPTVADSTKMPLLGLNSGLQATILHRDFKIQGTIGKVGQKDKLGYQSLMLQVEIGLGKGYTDKEIVTAVIRAVQPGLQLRSYLESVGDLSLARLRTILRFHFHEKNATELYQALTNIAQQPNEDSEAFLMRALTIRQKILFASKESGSEITYDSSSVQSLFLHALETGLKDETIRAKLRPLVSKTDVSDEELIEAMFLAVSAETERSKKFNVTSPGKSMKARVSAVQKEDDTEKKEILAAIKQVKTDLSAMQNEMKTLCETVHNQNQNPSTAKPSRKCENCKPTDECRHCFHCGELNHIARYCRKGKQYASGNGQRLPPRDRV
ncbi:Retrovirus-related Pol poly from transposon opus [Paramuricea clavata]|uniref:Retrovirus-related Pol poly from transposon opus n=1 Tax=Paramuricea clavata TaxID=317549 RepID=A0A7D9EN05_PARCT|nr:Retrovirus-related Pol poly from transposon opus [Paramuricea clavata]